MKRQIEFNKESRNLLKEGVEGLAKAVSVTLGPKGRNVVIKKSKYLGHQTTKDGVTVAKEVFFDNPIINLGAEMIKSVAINTVNDAGDGTTSSVVLANAILQEGLLQMEQGGNPVMINNGIQKACKIVVDNLKEISTPITTKDEVIKIATISANGDTELGNIIGEAMYEVGVDGRVICEKSQTPNTSWELTKGISVDTGWVSPYFINKVSNMSCILDEPLILMYDDKIKHVQDFMHIVDFANSNNRSILIICSDMEGEAIQFMITNIQKRLIKGAVVHSPGFGQNRKDLLQDIALATKSVVASENNGYLLHNVTMDMLGSCNRVEITRTEMVITGSPASADEINSRIALIKENIKNTTDEKINEQYKERISRLSGKLGVIYLGAKTELEFGEKLDRVDDALSATKAGMDEGMVSGGGVALIRCLGVLNDTKLEDADEQIGLSIVLKSLTKPLQIILENAGIFDTEIINSVINGGGKFGYDAREDKYCDDMIAKGIIDPVKVTRCALENACSIAGLILTTECVIIDITEYNG